MKQTCSQCSHYIQHYTFDKRHIFRVHCGHCSFRRIKRNSPDSPACENFSPGVSDVDAFVTKEYLSKELLHYLMRLEILPEIQDEE
ncbi:MAG: hypothetical protein IJF34_13440 [Clostridia bacterium]|nr:hypothetical protein [Clostridia bacterium]MBQ4624539.1 hypothetical protein [Clostridia bacterium]